MDPVQVEMRELGMRVSWGGSGLRQPRDGLAPPSQLNETGAAVVVGFGASRVAADSPMAFLEAASFRCGPAQAGIRLGGWKMGQRFLV